MKKLLFSLTLLSALAVSFGASAKIDKEALREQYKREERSTISRIWHELKNSRNEDDIVRRSLAEEELAARLKEKQRQAAQSAKKWGPNF